MRRNATKVAAVVMSLAVTMTSVNLPTTAAAATKKVKLNKTKATLTVGKTTTLKVTKGGKAVKATFKSSNAKVAKVVTKSGKSTKIKALKKGTAKITATYAKKKYTCKITVKAKKVTATTAPTVEPTVAPTVAPTVVPTTAPATEGAFATKKNVAKLELKLTNAYSDKHTDTVLVGTNANLQVTALDEDGKPVANAPITLTEKEITKPSYDEKHNYNNCYGNLTSLRTLTTDAEGHVTFVYGLSRGKDSEGVVDAMRTDHVGSYKLTATVAGSNEKSDFTVKFAALTIGSEGSGIIPSKDAQADRSVSVVNNYDDKDTIANIVPGKNADGKGFGVNSTTDANGKKVEYVSSQQVSSGSKDHSVRFSSAVYLQMPSDDAKTPANDFLHAYNDGVGKYEVYSNGEWKNVVTDNDGKAVDASKLQYATVNFEKTVLSKHTKLELKAYLIENEKDKDDTSKYGDPISEKTLGSDTEDVELGTYSWQIKTNNKKGYVLVVAKIISKGQVNLDKNDGFVVKNIVGTFDEKYIDNAGNGKLELADDVKVDWSIDNGTTYTDDVKFTSSAADNDYLKNIAKALDAKPDYVGKGYNYTYSVPAFPRTGNAVITVRDKNSKVVTYYSTTTANDKNTNVVNSSNYYEISENEAKNSVGKEVTSENKNQIIVDSNATGTTHVIGNIVSDNKDVVIDASNNRVYSSVQWNPIPDDTAKNEAAVAFKGQQLTVTAQLVDAEGNPVNHSGVGIDYSYTNKKADGTYEQTTLNDKANKTINGSTKVIKVGTKTDEKGQATLVLSSENLANVVGVKATTNAGYKIVYSLNGKTISAAALDLYWLDFGFKFEESAWNDNSTTTKDVAKVLADKSIATQNVNPSVGSNWQYGVQPYVEGPDFVGNDDLFDEGLLKGYKKRATSAKGLESQIAVVKSNNTKVVTSTNKVDVYSEKSMAAEVEFKANTASIKNVELEFAKPGDKDKVTAYYAGSGNTTVNKKMLLDIGWGTETVTGSFVLPTGQYTVNPNFVGYFRVVDKFGNPVANEKVTIKSVNADGIINNVIGQDKTDANGLVKFTASAFTVTNTTDTITATVESTGQTESVVIAKVPNAPLQVIGKQFDAATKTLIIEFNQDIIADTVYASMFTSANMLGANAVKFTDGKTYDVVSAKVEGKKVMLTLTNAFNASVGNTDNFTVNFDRVYVDGVTYKVASAENGAEFTGEVIINGTDHLN